MNCTQTARIAILGLSSIGVLGWVPSSHAQMLQATVPAAATPAAMSASPLAHTRLNAAYAQLPLSFEENRGQTDEEVRFLSHGDGYTLFLTSNEAVLALRRSHHSEGNKSSSLNSQSAESAVLRLKLAGGNTHSQVLGIEELPGKSNYFIGNDPKKWRTNVPTYAKVRYNAVYPGVDLVYYGNPRQLEYDFIVGPNADLTAIRLAVSTADSHSSPLKRDVNGDVVIATTAGEVRLRKPIVYQISDEASKDVPIPTQDNRKFLDGHFVLAKRNQIAFEVEDYDHSKPLVIDPVVAYSTYLGGSTDVSSADAIATFTNNAGHVYVYVAGRTCAGDFPTLNAAQSTFGGGCGGYGAGYGDAFVTKFDPSAFGAASVIYSTYIAAFCFAPGGDGFTRFSPLPAPGQISTQDLEERNNETT